jgi:hypothetical protein
MRWLFCLFIFLLSCTHDPNRVLKLELQKQPSKLQSPYFLVIMVDARQLNYTSNQAFFRSMVKHPSDGSKNSDVGHAWIYLKGMCEEKSVVIEGGHSGERGDVNPKYFEGVMNYIDYGFANPSYEEMQIPRYEPNPIKYLFESLDDGFFQQGSGGHKPTFAICLDLTEEQFLQIYEFIKSYDFQKYSLISRQCCTFVKDVAAIAGLHFDCEFFMEIGPEVYIGREKFNLWEDPKYRTLRFFSPEKLEEEMMQAVLSGKAKCAKIPTKQGSWQEKQEAFFLFPERLKRLIQFY